MRHEQPPFGVGPTTAEFRFNFQMTSMGARHASSVTIRAASRDAALTYFRENWPTIERLARERLADKALNDRLLRLEATCDESA